VEILAVTLENESFCPQEPSVAFQRLFPEAFHLRLFGGMPRLARRSNFVFERAGQERDRAQHPTDAMNSNEADVINRVIDVNTPKIKADAFFVSQTADILKENGFKQVCCNIKSSN